LHGGGFAAEGQLMGLFIPPTAAGEGLFFPPAGERLGPWGLKPIPGLLDEERSQWIKQLPEVAQQVFNQCVEGLGEEEARCLFRWLSVREHGKRGKGKASEPDRDWFLLKCYDRTVANAAPKDRKQQVRLVSQLLHQQQKGRYGSTQEAIERCLRRLLAQRAARDAQTKAQFEKWLEAFSQSLPSGLLTGAELPDK
jgi:hypothetical protein